MSGCEIGFEPMTFGERSVLHDLNQSITNTQALPNVNKPYQSSPNSSILSASSCLMTPLITVWLQVRVLPGPPAFAREVSFGWASPPGQPKYRKQPHAK